MFKFICSLSPINIKIPHKVNATKLKKADIAGYLYKDLKS